MTKAERKQTRSERAQWARWFEKWADRLMEADYWPEAQIALDWKKWVENVEPSRLHPFTVDWTVWMTAHHQTVDNPQIPQ